jgi:nitrile hydratase accessory protein
MLDQQVAQSMDTLDIDNETPPFDHPWQAGAFGLIVQLHKSGHFTWPEWVEVFSAEIQAHPAQPGETTNDAYYRQWLAALEQVVNAEGFVSSEDIAARAEEWRVAYLNTPHGEAVHLANASCPPSSAHGHTHALRQPIAVVPAHH